MIPFNKPYLVGQELSNIQIASSLGKLSGNGEFTRRCQEFFRENYGFQSCFLTSSCTDALEMAALLFNIQPGDEVILPSFTFVSTANAFALRGAKLVFIDSKLDFPGLDESEVEPLITSKTKVIIAVHYGGVPCNMHSLKALAERYGIYLLEDAAQAIDSFFEGKALGSFGHLSAFSFHETKNIHCGEGGMLVVNDLSFEKRAEIIWEKGTNRSALFRGEIQKYGWVDLGSSFLLSEINAAFLLAQLMHLKNIQVQRKLIWEDYQGIFTSAEGELKVLPKEYGDLLREGIIQVLGDFSKLEIQSQAGNYHLFYLIFPSEADRNSFSDFLMEKGILAVFHYQSLHKSEFIQKFQPESYSLDLPNSQKFSDTLLRLPLFIELPELLISHFRKKADS